MTIVDVITVIIICVLLVILLALMAFVLIDFLKSREGRRMVRTMKDVCSTISACMSPSTPLQKEIREEERTIKQLEAQRADMERLAALKRKRDALFEEVGDKHVDRVEVKRNGERSERDARVYPSSLEWIKHDGSFAAEIGYTDNTSQVFYSGVHDLLLVEHLFRERKPINEEAVRL